MIKAQESPAQAYGAAYAEALALLRRIEVALASPERIAVIGCRWGHVGDMQRIRLALQGISDSLFREGEFA
jgi:hypothetical protein